MICSPSSLFSASSASIPSLEKRDTNHPHHSPLPSSLFVGNLGKNSGINEGMEFFVPVAITHRPLDLEEIIRDLNHCLQAT